MTTKRRRPQVAPEPASQRLPSRGNRVRVAGRVLARDAASLVIADALGAVLVTLVEETTASPGDLVVVQGFAGVRRIERARVVSRTDGVAPASDSEFGRLGLGPIGKNLSARARALAVVRKYFERQGFLEVDTAIRVPSPGLDAHVDAIAADGGFLITSPELQMKRLVAGGLPRVYQVVHVSRAGERGAWHEPEFSMLEWYRSFSGMEEMIADTEALVVEVARAIGTRSHLVAPDGRRIEARRPFSRLTVREAFRKYAGVKDAVDLAASDETRFFEVWVDKVEPALSKKERPVVLYEFPASQGALARACPDDDRVVERFEVYAGGIELCNGFGELTDPVEQRRRFASEVDRRRRTGAPAQPIDERFLDALVEGLPPSGGNALGFDRLVALALGARRIADVMAFPAERL